MVKVIETNISINNLNEHVDFQSRVIEVDSWKDYVDEIKNAKCVIRYAILGNMYGNSVPQQSRVEDLEYDDFHLSCHIYNYHGLKTKKLAYLINEK